MDVEKRQAVIDWLNNLVNDVAIGRIEIINITMEAEMREVETGKVYLELEPTNKKTVLIGYTEKRIVGK